MDELKTIHLTRMKGFDVSKICVATIVMEGSPREVAAQEKKLNVLGVSFKGIPAESTAESAGIRLTFVIAYIRVTKFTVKLQCVRLN